MGRKPHLYLESEETLRRYKSAVYLVGATMSGITQDAIEDLIYYVENVPPNVTGDAARSYLRERRRQDRVWRQRYRDEP